MSLKRNCSCRRTTNVGLKKSSNQDQFLSALVRDPVAVHQASGTPESAEAAEPTGTLLAVADGMGGHAHGEVASQIAIQSIQHYVAAHWRDFIVPGEAAHHTVLGHLDAAVRSAHQTLMSMSRDNPNLHGMGTTLTVAYVLWPNLYVGHAGDSRCCLLRGSKILQITTDQTLAQLVTQVSESRDIDKQPLDPAQLSRLLYNCLGGDSSGMDVECCERQLEPTDVILLCSDGLTEYVNNQQIAEIVGNASSTESACRQLVETAKQTGSTDNITVILARTASAEQTIHLNYRMAPTCDPLADTAPYIPPEDRILGSGI